MPTAWWAASRRAGWRELYAEHDVLLKLSRFEGLGAAAARGHARRACRACSRPSQAARTTRATARTGSSSGSTTTRDTVAALDLLARDAALRERLSRGRARRPRPPGPTPDASAAAFAAARATTAGRAGAPDERALRRLARGRDGDRAGAMSGAQLAARHHAAPSHGDEVARRLRARPRSPRSGWPTLHDLTGRPSYRAATSTKRLVRTPKAGERARVAIVAGRVDAARCTASTGPSPGARRGRFGEDDVAELRAWAPDTVIASVCWPRRVAWRTIGWGVPAGPARRRRRRVASAPLPAADALACLRSRPGARRARCSAADAQLAAIECWTKLTGARRRGASAPTRLDVGGSSAPPWSRSSASRAAAARPRARRAGGGPACWSRRAAEPTSGSCRESTTSATSTRTSSVRRRRHDVPAGVRAGRRDGRARRRASLGVGRLRAASRSTPSWRTLRAPRRCAAPRAERRSSRPPPRRR